MQRFLELSDPLGARGRASGSATVRADAPPLRHRSRSPLGGRRVPGRSARCWRGRSASADAEDAAITSLVQAEARGDTAEVISLITGCRASAACRARAAANAAALRHRGKVSIAEINPSSTFSVALAPLGTARVAWVAGDSLPARPVRARPPRGQRASGLHDRAAGRQPADHERRRLPEPLLERRSMGRRGPGGGRARAPGAAHGGAGARPRRPCSRRRTRAGTASGSGIPPRGGSGGSGGRLGPRPQPSSPSSGRRSGPIGVVLQRREHQQRHAAESEQVDSGDPEHQGSPAHGARLAHR